jgi:hypothetical protein
LKSEKKSLLLEKVDFLYLTKKKCVLRGGRNRWDMEDSKNQCILYVCMSPLFGVFVCVRVRIGERTHTIENKIFVVFRAVDVFNFFFFNLTIIKI